MHRFAKVKQGLKQPMKMKMGRKGDEEEEEEE